MFGDLEGQLSAAESAAFEAGVRELQEAERATVGLAARLAASRGVRVVVALRDGSEATGTVTDASSTWLLLSDGPREHLVPLGAVSAIAGASNVADSLGAVASSLGLGHALRALARERAEVIVSADGARWRGIVARVGKDHLDLRTDGDREIAVAFGAIVEVTSAPPA